jgi:hypothetical protein
MKMKIDLLAKLPKMSKSEHFVGGGAVVPGFGRSHCRLIDDLKTDRRGSECVANRLSFPAESGNESSCPKSCRTRVGRSLLRAQRQ